MLPGQKRLSSGACKELAKVSGAGWGAGVALLLGAALEPCPAAQGLSWVSLSAQAWGGFAAPATVSRVRTGLSFWRFSPIFP